MPATTNFDQWLEEIELEDADEDAEKIYSLYKAVELEDEGLESIWKIEKRANEIIVSEVCNTLILRIVSQDAKKAFLKLLRDRYMDGDDDV